MPDAPIQLEGTAGFHSLMSVRPNARPIITVEYDTGPCGFTVEFAAGGNDPERLLWKAEAPGTFEAPALRSTDARLFARCDIPSGHKINVAVKWAPSL